MAARPCVFTGATTRSSPVPLYLRESDVERLLEPAVAVAAVEAGLERIRHGEYRASSGVRLVQGPTLLMSALVVDVGRELGAGEVSIMAGETRKQVTVFKADSSEVLAVVEAGHLSVLRASALSAVSCRLLAREDARTLGVIGAGRHAEWQVRCIRHVLPQVDDVVAYARSPESLHHFAKRIDARVGEYYRDVAEQDIVVTATSSADPVLRGEWLRAGTLVCAAGAECLERRELDNAVLQRVSFVCCDSKARARAEAGDLVEPVAQGVLDWLEVYELAEVTGGETIGRQSPDDIVLAKIVGTTSLTLALAETLLTRADERGVGVQI